LKPTHAFSVLDLNTPKIHLRPGVRPGLRWKAVKALHRPPDEFKRPRYAAMKKGTEKRMKERREGMEEGGRREEKREKTPQTNSCRGL